MSVKLDSILCMTKSRLSIHPIPIGRGFPSTTEISTGSLMTKSNFAQATFRSKMENYVCLTIQ